VKILYVDQTGQLGGAELSMLDLVKHLPYPGEVALFADGPFRHALEETGISVHVLQAGAATNVRRESGIKSILHALPALATLRERLSQLISTSDLIYTNTQKAFVVSALASRKRNQPLVWHLRDMLTASHFSPLLRQLVIFLANHRATAVIANSHATKQAFIDAGGNKRLVTVVHNGISSSPFDSIEETQVRAVRAEIAAPNAYLVGVFGRLSSWKGQHILLDALTYLPDVHAVFVGDALFGEDAYAEELKTRAQNNNLLDRVHFLGFRKDIPVLMKAMNIITHTSISPEPFGRVLVEGMLAGRPVVATRAGGALEIIEDQKTGLLVSPANAQELVRAIQQIRNDPNFAAQVALAAQQRAREKFSLQAMVAGVKDILNTAFTGSCKYNDV